MLTLRRLDQALQPSATSPSPVPDQSVNRRASVVNRSTSSLIRRRSLVATPGLATRSSPPNAVRRTWNAWKGAQADPQEHKWKVEMMGTSPLTRLAALDLADDGRDSPTPRAQTPGDMDYSHLGSLKLGSLVVTNGAASPAVSARKISRRRSNADISQEEDYFTASEGTCSPLMGKPARKRGHSRSKSSVFPKSPLHRGLRISDESRRAKTTSRCDSPLKMENRGRDESDSELEPMKRRLHVVNKSADTLARDYMAEIPDSPFRKSEDTTAGHRDEGFSDSFHDNSVSFREEAFRILDGTIFGESMATREHSNSIPQVPQHEVTPSKERRKSRPTPRKADSGYSSGGSFRTAHREAKKESTVPTLSKQPPVVADLSKRGNGSDSDDAVSLYTFEQMLALPISQKPLPPTPTDEDVEPQPSRLQVPDIALDQKVAASSPISPRTTQSAGSYWTMDSSFSTQKRLQKRRPSYQELPVVQSCQPVAEGTIPNIPDNVRAKFVRRLSHAPEMECLTQTYQPKDHINSEESVIDSPVVMSIEFPSPSSSPAPRPRNHRRSQTERPPTPPPHGFRRSLSLFRNKSEAEKQKEASHGEENAAVTVVDLGTIGSALGRSPYDVAMSAVPRKAVTSPTHPHQLGNALPRAKSMVNMDAKCAAEVARLRSKDRALLRPEMPQRPRSYHEMNIEAGEAMAFKRRPHSIYSDVPPVPTVEYGDGSLSHSSAPQIEDPVSTENRPGPGFRARSTGRGPVVSQLIDKYDHHGQKIAETEQQNWESHARLWRERRKSIGEGLRQRTEASPASAATLNQRASSQPPEDMVMADRYGGGLSYGYEGRGYGIGGSAGTRQLHSAASRKSMHFSNQFGVDLSDVPVFVQRV